MALFDKTKTPFSYDVIREGDDVILSINLEDYMHIPSIEDDAMVMAKTCDMLIEVKDATKIVFMQKRNYEYDANQTELLKEVSRLYNQLTRRKDVFGYNALLSDTKCSRWINAWYSNVQNVISNLLRSDPIGAYVELIREARDERIKAEKSVDNSYITCSNKYADVLDYIIKMIEKTKLITLAKPYTAGHKVGDREIYRRIFAAIIRPDFMFTKIMAAYPTEGEEIDSYTVGKDIEVTIFELPETVQYLYHIIPPEFKLSEEKYEILDTARKIMAEHKPKRTEFIDPERMRQVFYNLGSDLIDELAAEKNISITSSETEQLTNILVRYTVGFGLIEVLLQDEKVQDITVNNQIGEVPMFIVHQDYGDCKTNIIPTMTEAESWATKFRLISGRPLDEANPILDTELELATARARVAVVGPPLNPLGLAYSFRRHRDMPWTLPLFINNRMISPLAAGLISFLIDGSRTILVAGTRSAGKTSLLGSILVELMRKYRVLTIEDSVTPDSTIYIRRNAKLERTTIGGLIDSTIEKYGSWYNLTEHEVTGNPENIEIFSMDKEGKIVLAKASKFIRHKVKKPIFEIQTRTGRNIKATGDHSLFGINGEGKISEVKANNLKINDFIAVPRKIELFNKHVENLDILEHTLNIGDIYFIGEGIKKINQKYKDIIKNDGKELGYNKSTVRNWIRKSILPSKVLKLIFDLGFYFDKDELYFKYKKSSNSIPVKFPINDKFLTFIGLWIADGSYDKSSVIISCNYPEDRKIVEEVAHEFGLKVKLHSDTVSYMLNSKTLKVFMQEILNLKGNAYTKRIPEWVFNLSKGQIAFVLRGIFSGDGCATDKELVIALSSKNLLKDMQFLLSLYGILLRIGPLRKDKTHNARISSLKFWISFRDNIGFLQDYKQRKLGLLCNKISIHDSSDVIPLNLRTKQTIRKYYKDFKYRDYILRENNIGREKLTSILEFIPENKLLDNLSILAKSDIFWDQIKSIRTIENYDGYVYDISVPECESFVCENIIAHNTLELPTASLRKLGYNIQPMKVAAALTRGTSEVPADEGIRTTLRMGDSALIIGEIRSKEALALYEAMRIGALANVVAGTIHGDSPYGVFDRVVNDLQVPRTSFKATDIIIVTNPIRSPDGLHRWRRVTQITEVRKYWENDPLLENGFVDLMKYDTRTDQLEPTDELINGDSEILKNIAGNVKEWAGSWDAVWDNIMLRAKMKDTLVNVAKKENMMNLLEADFVVRANDKFHKISDTTLEDTGTLNSKKIFFDWNEWLKTAIKKINI